MTVTQLLPLDNKRSRVWLDEEFAFVLYKGELRRFNIEEGKELSEHDYKEIMAEILPKRAKMRAMNLLKSHTYSVAGLRQKLKEGYYPDAIIDLALDYVASYGYTDDGRMAEEYIRIHSGDKSRQRIILDLTNKGIDKEIILRAFDACMDEGFEIDEEKQIAELLKKRGYNPDTADEKEKAKQYAFLMRKGFKSSACMNAIIGR